jgi:hypothetical protein
MIGGSDRTLEMCRAALADFYELYGKTLIATALTLALEFIADRITYRLRQGNTTQAGEVCR